MKLESNTEVNIYSNKCDTDRHEDELVDSTIIHFCNVHISENIVFWYMVYFKSLISIKIPLKQVLV